MTRPAGAHGLVRALPLAAILAACGGARGPAPPDAVVPPRDRDSLMATLHAFGRSFGESRAAIIDRLGEPDAIKTRTIPNVHVEGAVDTAVTLRYPDRRFGLLRPEPTPRDLLISAEFWAARATVAGVVRIGTTTRTSLLTALGEPARADRRADTTVLAYLRPPTGAEEEVRFAFVRDTLRAVEWSFYFD